MQSYHISNDKVFSCESVVVVEEEWLNDVELIDGEIFPMPLIKCAKTRVNQKQNSR